MPREARRVTRSDILSAAEYGVQRKELRAVNVARKRNRRLAVGPYVTVHFENYDTMWTQIQEMLFIEKGGEEQIVDELAAYNPMIPNGQELTATLMFEIEDERLRRATLAKLGHVEDNMWIAVGGDKIKAVPEQEVERTTADGKTSSVHFLHFPFTQAQIAAFRDPSVQVTFNIDHPHYGHIAIFPAAMRTELAADFASA